MGFYTVSNATPERAVSFLRVRKNTGTQKIYDHYRVLLL